MAKTMSQESFSQELFDILEEAFETHRGIFLDKGTSLLTTLDGIGAAEASIPVGGRCATIAAQVEHVIFYLEVLERGLLEQEQNRPDWGEIWGRVHGVSEAEWAALRTRLRATYERITQTLRGIADWEHNEACGYALGMLAHTAYHLGEIRQALCTVRA